MGYLMAEKKVKKKMGRPLKHIDWELAEKLAYIHCTVAEIGAVMNLNQDTLADRCKRDNGITISEFIKKFHQ